MRTRNIFYCVSAFIFTAAGLVCPVYAVPVYVYGGPFDLRIPENPDENYGWMADAVIEISDNYNIFDLDVKVTVTHSSVFDLQLFLVSPADTVIMLNGYGVDDFFEGADYIQTVFDDEALIPIEEGEVPFTGRYRPRESLNIFDGESTLGEWRLRICDQFPNNTGNLDSFELFVLVPEPAAVFLLGFGSVFILSRNSNRGIKKR